MFVRGGIEGERSLARGGVGAVVAQLGSLVLADVEVVAARRLGRRRDDRPGEPVSLHEPGRELVAADRAGRAVVDPARAGEVSADDDLDGEHLESSALERPAVGPQGERVVRDEVRESREPEGREPGQDAPLVGDLGGQHDVEGRDAVRRNEQQPVRPEGIELPDLPASDVHCLDAHEASAAPRAATSARSRSKTVST